jgi:hypothetical protein
MRSAHQAVNIGPRADSMPCERRRDGDVPAERLGATPRPNRCQQRLFPSGWRATSEMSVS